MSNSLKKKKKLNFYFYENVKYAKATIPRPIIIVLKKTIKLRYLAHFLIFPFHLFNLYIYKH